MTMFALRAGPVFAATVKLMVVVPVPPTDIPVIQAGTLLLVVVHEHPAAVMTSNALEPPPAAAL